jgi:hypothetical protein
MATSSLRTNQLIFTTNGTTIASQVTASANTLTLVGDASALVSIAGVADPVSAQQVATKNYVDGLVNGVTWKTAAQLSTFGLGNITLSGNISIDGTTAITGYRILVTDQSTASTNGIYVAASGAWVRSTDMATGSHADSSAIFVELGTANSNKCFVCTTPYPTDVVGTNNLTFVLFSSLNPSTPGGAISTIQYNNSGSLGGASQWTTNGTTDLTGSATANLKLSSNFTLTSGGTNVIATNASVTGATNIVLGTTTSATKLQVEDSSTNVLFAVNGAGLTTIGFTAASGAPVTTGSVMSTTAQTFTDSSTAGSGTATAHAFESFAQPTLVATNASVTTTDAATIYIGGAPIAGTNETITNRWGLWAPDSSCNAKFGGDVYGNTFHTTSDINMKTDVLVIGSSLDKIRKIDGYQYRWKDTNKSQNIQYGVIAQQLERAGLSNLVSQAGNHKSVNYLGLIPLMIQSIKELTLKIENLERKI